MVKDAFHVQRVAFCHSLTNLSCLQKHELPVNMQPGSAGPQLPQMPRPSGDGGLPNLSEQELLMLQQAPQTSQTHDAISFWLDWVSILPL